jgi:DNA-binding MarR family transcriptional regulator
MVTMLIDQDSLFDGDPTRRKHGGNSESIAAFESIRCARSPMQREVILCAEAMGSRGVTLKEISRTMGIPIQTVSGRLTELKASSMLVKTGVRRDGCAVLTITDKGRAFARNV